MDEAVYAALGAMAGGVVVALTRGSVDHRRWLRDHRRDVYAAFLHAVDELYETTSAYMATFEVLLHHSHDVLPETEERAGSWWRRTRLAGQLEEEWQSVEAAHAEFLRQDARIELLAPSATDRASRLIRLTSRMSLPSPTELNDLPVGHDRLKQECDRWTADSNRRKQDRRDFLRRAREDLRVHPWSPQRAWWRLRAGIQQRKRSG